MFLLGTEERERERRKYKLICLIRGENHLEALKRKKYGNNKIAVGKWTHHNLLMK